jgi:hypothetical protein
MCLPNPQPHPFPKYLTTHSTIHQSHYKYDTSTLTVELHDARLLDIDYVRGQAANGLDGCYRGLISHFERSWDWKCRRHTGETSRGAAVPRLTSIRVVGNFEIDQICINVAYIDILTSKSFHGQFARMLQGRPVAFEFRSMPR